MAGPAKETIPVRLPPQAIELVDQLVLLGIYGSNRGEVTRQLILDQLKRLASERVIRLPNAE
jgi:Arc/MetJ-type ribon-helix-helix transcriptional regulator